MEHDQQHEQHESAGHSEYHTPVDPLHGRPLDRIPTVAWNRHGRGRSSSLRHGKTTKGTVADLLSSTPSPPRTVAQRRSP